ARAAQDRGDQAGRATEIRVATAATAATEVTAATEATAVMAGTDPVDPESRAVPAGLASRADQATPGATIPVVTTPAAMTPADRSALASRADTTLGRVRPGRMRVLRLPTQADRRTPADHRRDPTRAAAARQEARTPAAAARREVAIQAAAIQVAAATRKRLRLNRF